MNINKLYTIYINSCYDKCIYPRNNHYILEHKSGICVNIGSNCINKLKSSYLNLQKDFIDIQYNLKNIDGCKVSMTYWKHDKYSRPMYILKDNSSLIRYYMHCKNKDIFINIFKVLYGIVKDKYIIILDYSDVDNFLSIKYIQSINEDNIIIFVPIIRE